MHRAITLLLIVFLFICFNIAQAGKVIRAGDSREPVVVTPDVNVYTSGTAPVPYDSDVDKKEDANVRYGFLDIVSRPEGASVKLDGALIGMTPLRKLKLKEGFYTIEILKEGYQPWQNEIRVIGESEISVSPELKEKK